MESRKANPVTRRWTVDLVGAGPGDPHLMTESALNAVRAADIVFYDALVSNEVLEKIPARKRVNVGKRGGRPSPKQDEIHRRILAAARRGLRVVRLKGGDPFMFGRGGEEADFLRKHGFRVRVIPGISSGPAASAFAGFPLTDRRYASSVTFLTAASADGGKPSLPRRDYRALVRLGGTWVFFMGLGSLPMIVQKLIRSGASLRLPAAVVSCATTPRQRVVTSPLRLIANRVARHRIVAPAITIVGPVVRLRRHPLACMPVLVLRPEHQAGRLSGMLRQEKAVVTEYPAIGIAPIRPNPPLVRALESLSDDDWIIFTSANSVNLLKESLRHPKVRIRIAAIGPGTAQSLRAAGLRADLLPDHDFSAEGLARTFLKKYPQGAKILIPQAKIAHDTLANILRRAGHRVMAVPVYLTIPASRSFGKIREWTRRVEKGIVPLTSASIAAAFAQATRNIHKDHIRVVSIGPVTTESAMRAGLDIAAESPRATLADLIETLETVA